MNTENKHAALTAKIIQCAQNVFQTLGSGLHEILYQRAMDVEMREAGINFIRDFSIPVFYRNNHIGVQKIDFLVEKMIPVELESINRLEKIHYMKTHYFLESNNFETGLLLNFGEVSLNCNYLANPKYQPDVSAQSINMVCSSNLL